ncbi:papain-like cysteine protease family protein [Xylanibacillus composti]|uniref:Peptidase C39-like domain-containing protein n=1 Tax=Xylanibacillus composti TaxID=1572762 RepID=A0A8J4M3S2_9BACL|nr:papain-like cysteine protease family protein [Xylanibacillus composti]GIQ71160.1 hypothetical protein XYCOK13_39840 [Xylanibacillus composti]
MVRKLSLLSLSYVLIFALSFVGTSTASTTYKLLDVVQHPQEKSNWCWVAASKSIVQYHTGTAYTQCQIYKWGKGTTDCPNEDGSWSNYQNVFDNAGFVNKGTEASGTVTLNFIKGQIDADKPMIIRKSWLDSSTGKKTGTNHAAPVIGYNTSTKRVAYINITYSNPSNTGTVWRDYDYMVDNTSYEWTKSRYGMYK